MTAVAVAFVAGPSGVTKQEQLAVDRVADKAAAHTVVSDVGLAYRVSVRVSV